MQVATLFRETATLLGASMEAPDSSGLKLGSYTPEGNTMKQEQQDDGYETSSGGELDMRGSHMNSLMGVGGRMNCNTFTGGPLVPMMKYEPSPPPNSHDPYSFVEDDQQHHLHHHHHHHHHHHQHHQHQQHIMPPVQCPPNLPVHVPKKRGRKKKIKIEDLSLQLTSQGMGYQGSMDCLPNAMRAPTQKIKERKKHDRFNGMSEDEVSKRTLPDHLAQNLDIVIIGINPGLFAAYKGHHYAGPGNHFWKCLYLSGLTPEPMTADDDYKLLKVGIGFTNMVERATKGSADLTRKEIKEGSQILLEKLRKFRPKIAVFNGKLIFEVFSGKKDFSFGRQPELVDGTNTYMWVMPSSSARCAQLPRAADKVPFYAALKKFRDYLNGKVPEIDDKELTFSHAKLKNFCEPELKDDLKDSSKFNRLTSDLTDLSQTSKKDDEPMQPKKKRGRPKKIKIEGEVKQEEPKPKIIDDKTGIPKKKRGRPKKVKIDSEIIPQTDCHSDPSNHCFSPPIQSPMMQGYSMYQQPQFNQNSTSPLPNSYHQSPIPSQTYNQSPQQHSFTHSDLSSEISAAISSENNPESPAIGPHDFDPPANLNEEVSKSPQQKDDDCHFSSPQSKKSFQNYDDFSTDSDSVRYPPKQVNQDVSSKSLSGLESLVDQIPNITDGETPHAVVNADSQHMSNQYSEDSSYISEYPRPSPYSPQYNTATSNSYMQHSNFSVSSLANSSASDSSFSVTSLASNYTPSTYPNIMPSPMPAGMVESSNPLFSNSLDRTCRVDSSNMPPNSSIPYPYPQYSTPYSNSSSGFYPPSHNIHMPSPNFPYPSPYSNSSYPQPPSYLPNHVFDRIKHDRMDIGFGGF